MIRELKKGEIGSFLDFGDSLYRDDPNYVPFIRLTFRKTMKKLVFEKKTYTALCSFDEKGRMNGRLLLTVGKNKQLQTEHCGYFSHFEAVNDQQVFDALMERAALLLKQKGAEYMLGSFFPHDPDDRRGIVVQGFELAPMLFTSHNPPYYQTLFVLINVKVNLFQINPRFDMCRVENMRLHNDFFFVQIHDGNSAIVKLCGGEISVINGLLERRHRNDRCRRFLNGVPAIFCDGNKYRCCNDNQQQRPSSFAF